MFRRVRLSAWLVALIGVLVLPDATYAQSLDPVRWPLIEDDRARYLVAELWTHRFEPVVPLNVKVGNAPVAPSSVRALLEQYYSAIMANDFERAAGLFYEKDGSKRRFLEIVSQNPQKLQRYQRFDSVFLGFESLWGPYHALGVILRSKGGRELRWQEFALCEARKCYLTNYFDANREALYPFNVAHGDYYRKIRDTGETPGVAEAIPKGNKVSIFPKGGSVSSTDNYPLNFYYQLGKLSPRFIRKPFEVEGAKQDSAAAVAQSLSSIWAVPADQVDPSGKGLSSALSDFWKDYRRGHAVPIFEKSSNGGYYVSLFTEYAFWQRVNKWIGLVPVGEIRDGQYVYVFFIPVRSDGFDPIQVIPLDEASMRPSVSAYGSRSWRIISTPELLISIEMASQKLKSLVEERAE